MGYGANLNAQTLDGDTPLHLILSETKQIVLRNVADMPHLIKVTNLLYPNCLHEAGTRFRSSCSNVQKAAS